MVSIEQLLAKQQVPAVTSVGAENILLCSSRWGERKDENSPDHCYLKKDHRIALQNPTSDQSSQTDSNVFYSLTDS